MQKKKNKNIEAQTDANSDTEQFEDIEQHEELAQSNGECSVCGTTDDGMHQSGCTGAFGFDGDVVLLGRGN